MDKTQPTKEVFLARQAHLVRMMEEMALPASPNPYPPRPGRHLYELAHAAPLGYIESECMDFPCVMSLGIAEVVFPCVYQVTFDGCKEYYIGQTKHFMLRISQHITDLRAGIHCNTKMQIAFDTIGEKSIRFGVIEVCDVSDLADRERHWIRTLRPGMN